MYTVWVATKNNDSNGMGEGKQDLWSQLCIGWKHMGMSPSRAWDSVEDCICDLWIKLVQFAQNTTS